MLSPVHWLRQYNIYLINHFYFICGEEALSYFSYETDFVYDEMEWRTCLDLRE